MHLFGCKFSLQTDNGDTIPDRKNFDSLLWAIVTVFQVSFSITLNLLESYFSYFGFNNMCPVSVWFICLVSIQNHELMTHQYILFPSCSGFLT